MKCPKCGYLGFEDMERCRNCGYDFSLTAAAPLPELTLRRDTGTFGPLDDLALVDAATAPRPAPQRNLTDATPDIDRVFSASSARRPTRPTGTTGELPALELQAEVGSLNPRHMDIRDDDAR